MHVFVLTLQILSVLYWHESSVFVSSSEVDLDKTFVWGPGLNPDFFVPVRYFFIQAVDANGDNITESLGNNAFDITVTSPKEKGVRIYRQTFDVKDGSYIFRYRLFGTYDTLEISILHAGKHVAKSPYILEGLVHHESCSCPEPDIQRWYASMGCPASYHQIKRDLSIFKDLNLEDIANQTVNRFNKRGMHSLCHYRIIDNKIYRKTYGEHVGFKMFSDATLLSLTRKVHLPDMEFFVNLGDWPLEKRKVNEGPLPMFSWCGSDDSRDIVMPTYDLTESTVQMMSRVSLDVMSVLGKSDVVWEKKTDMAFWRGRDSRQERLDLVVMSRKYPEIIDAAMTHMFFFPKDVEKYGELVKSISFFDFFKHKYQINLDGTVAAYRLPYLLAGNSVVLRQDSPYYEHFYKDLRPFEHYIPFKRDLSDLMEKIQWAKDNDEKVQQIVKNARDFVRERLLPKDIFCYHVKLFEEYSKKLKVGPLPPDDSWELVPQPDDHDSKCECRKNKTKAKRDEL